MVQNLLHNMQFAKEKLILITLAKTICIWGT